MAHGTSPNPEPITVDLLSDTVTRPSGGMRSAMAAAEVGDDVFGEDPTVNLLQERVAELLGHEAALYTPTGSMANQLGVRLSCAPGQELIGDSLSHVLRSEMGAAAVFSGITSRTWTSDHGRLDPADPLALMVTGGGVYQVNTALIVVENTHNFGGGTVQSLDAITELRAATAGTGVKMHLDGARLWNAHVATGISMARWAASFDTVNVCLSKGLGAPVGSVLAGSRETIDEARIWRKRYGAGMRQVGILAAAGLYALDHNIDRLADDHARAHRFAEAVAQTAPGSIDPDGVETNIVIIDVSGTGWTGAELVTATLAEGVRSYAISPTTVRYVWHLDVDDAATDRAIEVVTGLLREPPRGS